MARTPLLRSFERLAADYERADGLGISLAEIRARQQDRQERPQPESSPSGHRRRFRSGIQSRASRRGEGGLPHPIQRLDAPQPGAGPDDGLRLGRDPRSRWAQLTNGRVDRPFAVLRTLDYNRAGFNDLKKLSIDRFGRGQNAKLQLQFDRRAWNHAGPWPGVNNGDTYTDSGYQNTWDSTRGQPGRQGILTNYTGGDAAAAFHPTDAYAFADSNRKVRRRSAQNFLAELEGVLPGISAHWNGRATLSAPAQDPNLMCSYAVFGAYQGKRQGNAHFAGEHCSEDYQGYMEGGAAEGIRAAREILNG